MKNQQRFILALVASAAILIIWNYLFPPPKPPQNANANTNANVQQSASPSASSTAQVQTTATPAPAQSPVAESSPDAMPQRKLTIVTPLYTATFDTHGAVATSWIIKKNRDTGRDIYGASSTKTNPQPLELIPTLPEGVQPDQFARPFQVTTGDAAVDATLANRNYRTFGPNAEAGDETINVPTGSKQIDFVIHDDATGLDATKRLTFFADRYMTQLELKLTRNNQAVPDAKIVIGPNIGDQTIDHYSFYLYAPEGIAQANGAVNRFNALQIHADRRNNGFFSSIFEWVGAKAPTMKPADRDAVDGPVQWAGVDDTYFGMVAVAARPMSGLEYRTVPYEHKTNGKPDPRYLVTGFVPVAVDGSKTLIYVGPKDHRLLAAASEEVKQLGGPQVDLGEVINYGFLGSMRRALAVPILWSISKLQRLTSSYGIAIILFTIFIYSLFFPLKWQSSRKMKKAQKYAPRMKELQEQLKGMKQSDPRLKELQMEQLRLMKEANPLGGCLPLLIQMPFLFALYTAITISIDFRQASFLWIPDLSGPEPFLFGLTILGVGLRMLPILFAGSMIVLQLLTPAPSADPLQRKMMAVGMPLFMLYILWSAPAGLLLYWLVGNIVGFLQQMLINKLTTEETPPPDEKAAKKKPAKKLKTAAA
ncbi:MAG TPA: membrane protein insertase YidC [Pyrinomonadaceae bacterium]|nr:membrane protein insertase YidC [Pyrinomonadaceae bacterium]